jgi:hypothetical protein
MTSADVFTRKQVAKKKDLSLVKNFAPHNMTSSETRPNI